MTVEELIKELEHMPKDYEVYYMFNLVGGAANDESSRRAVLFSCRTARLGDGK